MIKQKFHDYRQKLALWLRPLRNRLPARLRGVNGIIGLIVTLIILIIIVISLIENSNSNVEPVIAPVAVETVLVKQQTIPVNIEALGSLKADQQIDVSPGSGWANCKS